MYALKLGTFVSALFLSLSPALAAPSPTPPQPVLTGKHTKAPKADLKATKAHARYAPGSALAAWSWRDTGGEHVRLTVKDGEPVSHFSGKLCGKGLTAVTPVGLESGDVVTLDADGKCATFDVTTDAGEDGFDIRFASKADRITSDDFRLDGKPMGKSLVHTLDHAPEVIR